LVWADSAFQDAAELDAPGVRIAVSERTAYDLWLVRNIKQAHLVHAQGFDGAKAAFIDEKCEALACLRPALLKDVQTIAGTRIVSGRFTAIQQAIGTHRRHTAAAEFLQRFSQHAIRSGLVASLIEKHAVQGLSVAPLA
jgi:polar amino acid transport system substrate-binding protein